MDKYKGLYKWMFVPLIIMQLGIYQDYWGDFSENAWSVHIHYWTGTVWYLYLIIQPYFATHDQMARHRTNGIIGMFIAGGVCLTALSMMNRDMVSAQQAAEHPERFGPFEPWFFFGVAAVEIVMMTAFGFAVIKSIINRKRLEDHAWWLISTVFLIMMPALGRGLGNVYVALNAAEMPNVSIMTPGYITQAFILTMLVVFAWKYGKLRHPATYLAVGVNLFILLLEPIGRSETVQAFLKAVVKG